MKRIIIFVTAYPYAAGVIAIVWLGSAVLLQASDSLSFDAVLTVNALVTLIIALIGFRR
jgi:hypothetical protein